jgi:2-keto-4-pentenoate hydratase
MQLTDAEKKLQDIVLKARADRMTVEGKDGGRGVDLDGAYNIQAASQGDRVLKGYKLGLISTAKQQQMGINTPLYGRIYADMLRQNGIRLSDFIQPRLEPEIAVVLRDPVTEDSSAEAIVQAIGGYFLGVDILDSVWQDYKFTAPEVVADNTSGGGFLLAGRLSETMPTGTLRMYLNGELAAEGPINELGDPVQRLQWLARAVGGLQAGMIVFFGSPAAAVPTQTGTLEVVDSEGNTLVGSITG